TWYNTDRIQERIKGLVPMHYRRQALAAITN
ncbi:IS3 family transposase, partial [Corynebacterium kroppenstedtii]